MANNELVFMGEMDNWPHLYAVAATGGDARLLTPGHFMVENVVLSPDHRTLVYSANSGEGAGDEDRRHLFRVGTDGHAPEALTSGDGLEWSPAALAGARSLTWSQAHSGLLLWQFWRGPEKAMCSIPGV